MDRASKRAKKLEAMMAFQSNLPAHSQSALAAIVQRCKTHGIPECSSSKEQRHARLHLLEQSHGGGLGPLLQKGSLAMMDGTTRTVWYTSMLVLLCTMYRECPSFTALLQRRHAQKPSTSESPWSLQLYTDEVVPGNVLGRADRKFWTIYATIMEFDNHAQRENHGFHEQLWFTLCTIRSSIIMQADGGIAQVMAMILESIFCHDMIQLPHGGLLLKHPMGPQEDIRLHMTWNSMICDTRLCGAPKVTLEPNSACCAQMPLGIGQHWSNSRPCRSHCQMTSFSLIPHAQHTVNSAWCLTRKSWHHIGGWPVELAHAARRNSRNGNRP